MILLKIFLISYVASQSDASDDFYKPLSTFAIKLFQKATDKVYGNVMISPMSIDSALTMAMYGANGDTKTSLFNGLYYSSFGSLSYDTVLNNFQQMMKNLNGNQALQMAIKIYVTDQYNLSLYFKSIATDSFLSEIESINFEKNVDAANTINNWVSSKTNQRIQNLIDPSSLINATRLVFINTIFFTAFWIKKFPAVNTKPDKFYTGPNSYVKGDFMNMMDFINFADFPELNATAVKLDYKNSPMTMIILLPNSRTGLAYMKSQLDQIDWANIQNRFSLQTTVLKIPKFKYSYQIDVKTTLKKMGLSLMFEDKADFTNMINNYNCILKIDKVLHKTFISVHENGTEAAAATGIDFAGSGPPTKPINFIANHPFIFMLQYAGKSVHFIGQVSTLINI
ncbi:hypothetical protein PVAND_014655 [Polypedilum vanderplanki]|uniref:Serpin domain-containing protein n=1 Tax=Polypedilum vanderplanki TaxID=319348 RepID=A0A9J6BAC7_POLVA|nr:hypothetical protein PVAND_014655 [Polypedilum vanderplanki]